MKYARLPGNKVNYFVWNNTRLPKLSKLVELVKKVSSKVSFI